MYYVESTDYKLDLEYIRNFRSKIVYYYTLFPLKELSIEGIKEFRKREKEGIKIYCPYIPTSIIKVGT